MVQWPVETLWEAVAPILPGFTVEVLAQIDSTNAELMRRVRASRLDPVLLVAEVQTAGRGRLGRQWDSGSTPGAALTFSLGLPLHMTDWSGLSLAVGVSLAQSLHPRVQLKWPNDLWLDDRKLAGILIETTQVGDTRYAVIGVGLNITQRPASGLATPPAWLQELEPTADAAQALQRVAVALVADVKRFESGGWAQFRPAYTARDVLAGREVVISDGTIGQAMGVDGAGALLVHTPQGLHRVSSSEVSVRPRV